MTNDFEKCPTCGRFVSFEDGFGDLPPGGDQFSDFMVPYCDESCANAKPIPCVYEDGTRSGRGVRAAVEGKR